MKLLAPIKNDEDIVNKKYVDTAADKLQSQVNNKADKEHNHDNRYYTESEVDSKVSGINETISDHISNTSNPHGVTKSDVGLGNVGNFKAVSTVANQGLTDTEKTNARANIGAGTSSFSGSYNDLTNKPTIPTVGNGTVTIKQAGTSKGTFTMNQSGNTIIELTDNNTTYGVATQSSNGLESAADKKKLDGIATGAEVNQNAFSNVIVGSTTISADSKTDSLTLIGSNVTITPDADNDKVTIGITKANVTSALGYTPPTTNTDTKVTQTNTTTSADYRIALSYNSNDTTETQTLRKSTNFLANPSTGEFYAKGYRRIDISGQTLDINTLNLSSGSPMIMYYIEKTSGGSSNITNIPVKGNPFLLDVELIRWASTSDYITRQTFRNAANPANEYVRFCTNGTWGSWITRVFTDTNTDTKVTSVYKNPSSSDPQTTFYPTWVTGATTGGVLINDGIRYATLEGTDTTNGYGIFILGNNTSSGSDGNKYGAIRVYGTGSYYGQIAQINGTSNVNHSLPATSGTILNTGTTSFTQSLTSGTKIGSIKINNTSTDIYAPTNTDTKVTNTLATTTKAYITGTTTATTNTGTQVFDTGVYLDDKAGHLTATQFNGKLNGNATSATKVNNALDINGVSYDGSVAKDIDLLPFIVGTQTAATGTWTGNAPTISALFDGLTIRYWLPYAGSGNATLNLTLADGTKTGNIYCYYGGTSRLSTHYGAGNIITLTYRENITIAGSKDTYTGWWADANYNVSNTAGSTNTASKIFLIGATSQKTASTTYSNSKVYVGKDSCLYSNGTKVSVEGHTHAYLPLTGGTISGDVIFDNGDKTIMLGQHTATGAGEKSFGHINLYSGGSIAGNIYADQNGGLIVRSMTNNTGSIGDGSHYFGSAYINNLDKVTMIKSSGDVYHRAERTDLTFKDSNGDKQHEDIRFGISNAGNRGIWDRRSGSWLTYFITGSNDPITKGAFATQEGKITGTSGEVIKRVPFTAGRNFMYVYTSRIPRLSNKIKLVNNTSGTIASDRYYTFGYRIINTPTEKYVELKVKYIGSTTPPDPLWEYIVFFCTL